VVAARPGPAPAARPEAPDLSFYKTRFTRRPPFQELVELGRKLFSDPVLSASGRMSCATCHDPARAYGPPNDRAVQLGGLDGKRPGARMVPSLRYLYALPAFTEHTLDNEDDTLDQGPTGGFTWDGRGVTRHDQARMPLFSPFEMANPDIETLVRRVRAAPIAAAMKTAFGDDVLDSPDVGLHAITLALENFEQSPPDFQPFDSKYDAYLQKKAQLSPAEERGLRLFNDQRKGNCAICHISRWSDRPPMFTDFGFIALGVPRNRDIPANADPKHFDLGLCGPIRTDLADHEDYCGKFRAPSLRNVALRRRFMHNGYFRSLTDVVRFYAERDLQPAKFYPRGKPYDDLPPAYRANLNRDPPFDRKPGDKPALTEAEIADIVTFLGTLTDGYRP